MFSIKTTFDSSAKTWSGPKKERRFPPECSVGEALFQRLKMNPDDICQISDMDGVSLTNEEMLTITVRIAQNLKLEEGEMVGIMAGSSTYQAPVLFAAWLSGAIVHPINATFDQKTICHVFGITRPKVVFCDADNYETLVESCKQLNLAPRIYTINKQREGVGNVHDLMQHTGTEKSFCPQNSKKNEDSTAMILCSSGTTGLPKGVCLSHLYLLGLLKPIPRGTISFCFSNIHWLSGLSMLLHSALSSATRVCTIDSYSPHKLRELIEKYKINFVSVGATCLTTFIKSGEAKRCDLSSVRIFFIGGSIVSHHLYARMQEYLTAGIVTNVYVGTEFGGVAINMSVCKPKCVGQILEGVKVRIVDDDYSNLGVGETGEILVWNGRNWSGYYGNALETKNMINDDGWYHTGDLGFFDEDGDLYVVDRKKEIMKYKRQHYSAQQIENCILKLSDVSEVCVFGTRDDESGNLATAAVILKPESALSEKEIIDYVASELSEEKWLHGGVYFVDEIPKTSSGKYIRAKTRDMCLSVKSD